MPENNQYPDATVCLILNAESNKVLLGWKKRGFAAGILNGYGGKVQENESPEEAAIRETKEESGLDVQDLERVGVVHFIHEKFSQIVHFFVTNNYSGELKETEEMKPEWFPIGEIPSEKMWTDSRVWVPLVLAKIYFTGECCFDSEDKMRKFSLDFPDNI
jgi:ADP-ribose pyrophosphatase YjhB (NUDIX family)